jgi:hypothetical protein
MNKARSGGGATMNKNVRPPMPKPAPARAVSPAGASQLGSSMGNMKGGKLVTAEHLFQGKAPQSKYGNEVALNVGKGGPGAGRTVYAKGTEAVHGPVAGIVRPAQTGDILRSYGPDVVGKEGKR